MPYKIIRGTFIAALRHTHIIKSMMIFSKLRPKILVMLVLYLTFSHQISWAYLLRGPHLLTLMTKGFGDSSSLMVSQKVLFYNADSGEILVNASETLRYVFPDRFRSDSRSVNATRIHLVAGDRSITIIDDKISTNTETPFDLYKDILLYRSRKLLERNLEEAGIDISLTCLGRFEEKVAIVLGAEKTSDKVSQVWIDKETFRPIRWLVQGVGNDPLQTTMEIRYADWRRVNRAWYPMQVGIYKDEVLVQKISVAEIRVNPAFPKDMLDVEQLEIKYLQSTMDKSATSVDGELNEIEKTINEFRKRIEE